MIYDCFTFFNELDLLEIRLNILNEVVDKFVIVEMDKTHTNKEKPFYFDDNKERYYKFLDKIIHIKLVAPDDFNTKNKDSFNNNWFLENYQRNGILKGLVEAKENDDIIISDCDEIPNPKIIKELKNTPGIKCLEMPLYYYYLNCYSLNERHNVCRMFPYIELSKVHELPKEHYWRISEEYRNNTNPNTIRCLTSNQIINNAGWHFSYLGGANAILQKRNSIVEQQFNTEKNMSLDFIEKSIKDKKDIFERDRVYELVKIDKTFPEYIIKNQEKYKNLIKPITLRVLLDKYNQKIIRLSLAIIKYILKKIFSVYNDSNKTHKVINIFGIKIKFKKV